MYFGLHVGGQRTEVKFTFRTSSKVTMSSIIISSDSPDLVSRNNEVLACLKLLAVAKLPCLDTNTMPDSDPSRSCYNNPVQHMGSVLSKAICPHPPFLQNV
jgi:hypothetical protein